MSKNNWVIYKMSDILEPISIPVDLKSGIKYREIGIRSHGKGIFHKEITNAETIGNKRVFEVIPNALIFNIVFAWEQAVAKTSEEDKGFIASHRFPQYLPKDNLSDIDYLLYLFMSPKGKYLLNLASPGGAGRNKTLGKKAFDDLELKLPTTTEQQIIAKILSTWDQAISKTERLIDNSTQQKKALMQQLLTGKKRLLDESGKRFEGEWEEVTIGSTSKCFSGGTPSRSKEEYYGGKIPWITSGKLNDRFVYSVNEYITELGVENSSAKLVKKESILIAMYGATAGRVAVNMLDGATVNQAVLALEPKKNFHKLFLFYLFEVEMVKALQLVQGGQPNLSASIIKSIKVRIPILSEQQKIATVLTTADKEIELLEQQLADLQQEKKALMQVLLTGKVRVLVDGKVA